MNAGAAPAWFDAGAIIFMLAGALHLLLALLDSIRPRWFAPIDSSVTSAMQSTGMRFRRLFPGEAARPSMWSFWLGFNASHGLGAFAFGLICLLIGAHDYALVERIDMLRPLTIAVSAAYFAIALRYWFNGVMLLAGAATACFAVAAVLSA